ncbi:methyltransferase domain containing protein [Acanthamoeba castellanii str. Neff]|uniref:Methyltransferase domain containing protein n=1 Tax=Acanthamoeba castellanii (strain ATCC 30010 / Neff) TaxID=1257118 RepID=L8HCU5_ACACF|nr:methyltransferase domain containing protein [Acanthamoeba castellanii str. Neff]ELR22568.1 methyltransferase domain containing protein [Acanthamoeba castellanii str. Neff]
MEEGRTEVIRNDRVKAGGKVVNSGRKVQTIAEDEDEDRSVPKYVARYAPYTLGFYGYIPADAPELPAYKQYDKKAASYWHGFYQNNKANFFKDRHWLTREFPALADKEGGQKVVVELGCGVGNTIFPLLKENAHLFFYGLDFAPSAIELVKSNPEYDESRCQAFVCDITEDSAWPSQIKDNSVDLVTMIFVLSAISPERMANVVRNIARILKPGGVVLFRDYAVGDMAQKRFEKVEGQKKLGLNFHVRGDGTRAYYFSKEFTAELWGEMGFALDENDYCQRVVTNRKQQVDLNRLFLQGKYRKQ